MPAYKVEFNWMDLQTHSNNWEKTNTLWVWIMKMIFKKLFSISILPITHFWCNTFSLIIQRAQNIRVDVTS